MRSADIHRLTDLTVSVYRVPLDPPESDGTLQWDHTDVICVEAVAGGNLGLGWTYTHHAAGKLIEDSLRKIVLAHSPLEIEGCWQEMFDAVRNDGRGGICAAAISAVDVALWDLKARLLDVSLVDLIGAVRTAVPIYGSGGFTSYDDAELTEQLGGWAAEGITAVKMKVGRDPDRDLQRVTAARNAIGDRVQLFVDANGGYSRKQALEFSEVFAAEANVKWFEEPVSSDDLPGLRLLRDRAPATMDIAAGEYGDTLDYFQRMLAANAVDCIQFDATRCGGITGFLKAAALADASHVPISAHCAPQLHAHIGCCVRGLRHVEYFHDHVRLAPLLFEGVLQPQNGQLVPDPSRAGHGLRLKKPVAEHYLI